MQELRFVAVSEDGSYAVLAVPGRSGRYILPIDERLRAVAMGQTSRLAQYEIEVESPLRPKEIQARIRAGETAEEIADAAGIPVERVRWFEGPVLAERAYIADQAQAASVRRAGDSGGPGPRLGDIVPERLTASGAAPEDGQWDSRKRGDGNWQVTLTFPSGGRLHVAEWVFDSRRRHVMPDDDNAARLSLPESELPPEPVSLPGEATVTPLAPRLGAAAGMGGGGMGGGGMGGGGFAGGGSGVGVRSFRPERSVIPDRSLGGDRSLADRPLSPPSAPVHAPAAPAASTASAASAADRPGMTERPAMSHGPAAPPATPWPAHHDHTAFRDAAPEPVAHRDPAPTVYRAAAPEQRAPEHPAPAGTVPVTAPPYVFEDLPSPAGDRAGHTPSRHVVFEEPEPAYLDEQPGLAPPPATGHAPTSASPGMPVSAAPEVAPAREFAPNAPAAPQTQQPDPAIAARYVTETVAAVPPPEPVTPAPAAAVQAAETSRAPQPTTPMSPAAEAPGAQPEPVTRADPTAVEPVSAPAAAPVTVESPAASATTTPAQPALAEPTEDQSARQRPGNKKSAKGRRSSVPSWDEIMLGSSRQRE